MQGGYSIYFYKDGKYGKVAWFIRLTDAYNYFDELVDEYRQSTMPVVTLLKDGEGRVLCMERNDMESDGD